MGRANRRRSRTGALRRWRSRRPCATPRHRPIVTISVVFQNLQGGRGSEEDFGLAHAWARARSLRLADGPDEVHRTTIAKLELAKQSPRWICAG